MPPTPSDRHATGRIRQEMAAFNFRAQQWRLALKLKANFDPNQPRVPAGNPDGGQWAGSGGRAGRRAAPKTATGTSQRVVSDESGREAWHSIVRTESTGGKLAEQTVQNRDGSTVRSVYPAKPGDGDRREGHLVRLPDGTARIFLSNGLTQSIFDGKGRLLSRSTWTENGPQICRSSSRSDPMSRWAVRGSAGFGTIRTTISRIPRSRCRRRTRFCRKPPRRVLPSSAPCRRQSIRRPSARSSPSRPRNSS